MFFPISYSLRSTKFLMKSSTTYSSIPKSEYLPTSKESYGKDFIYDFNTLYVEMNGQDLETLHRLLKEAFIQLRQHDKKSGLQIRKKDSDTPDYHINYRSEKQIAYVYIPSKEDCNRLCSCDHLGNLLYVTKIVPSGHTKEEHKAALAKLDEITDWADNAEAEEEINKQFADLKEYVLEPIVTVPGFLFLRSEQCDNWRDYAKLDDIVIMRARVFRCRNDLIPNVLKAIGFPPTQTVAGVRKLYSLYSTSKDTNYPTVSQQNNSFKITFDPNTFDGCFAQVMTGKNTVKINGKNHSIQTSYWRKAKQ